MEKEKNFSLEVPSPKKYGNMKKKAQVMGTLREPEPTAREPNSQLAADACKEGDAQLLSSNLDYHKQGNNSNLPTDPNGTRQICNSNPASGRI